MQITKTLFWLITILWLLAGTFWYRSCSNCHSCGSEATGATTTQDAGVTLPGFTVNDGSWSVSSPSNLRFGLSANTPVVNAEMSVLLDSIAAYAAAHPGKTLTVTGHYSASEKNNTTFANLGLARAEAVKSLLVSKGVAAKNILTQSRMTDDLVFQPSDTLVGGISMLFGHETGNGALVEEELFEPYTVYFNTAKTSLPVDDGLTNYIQKAKTYLENHSGKSLIITGYTDNIGKAGMNQQLSETRAGFVKEQLVTRGIPADRMTAQGRGMNDPVADNASEEGRSRNRRVTIQLQ